MLRSIAATLFALGLMACTELPPLPDAGTGGQGGQGGSGGSAGSGGAAGSGGTAGSGGVDPCSVIIPKEAGEIELDDRVQSGVAMGNVCADGCTTQDLLDQWSITTCSGKHGIVLTWDDASSDLDLYLRDSDELIIDQATGTTVCDSICEIEVFGDLQEGEISLIDVRAVDTNGIAQPYGLRVFPID